MENYKEKYENISESGSDSSTALLDLSKLEYNLKRLEALASASTSDVESEIDFDINDVTDGDKLDFENDDFIPKIPIRSYQNDDFQTRRYSGKEYISLSNGNKETSTPSNNILNGKVF